MNNQWVIGAAWAALLASVAGGALGCTARGGPEEDVAVATQRVAGQTCVVVRRGTAGAVSDTQIATGNTNRQNQNFGSSATANSGTVPNAGDRQALFRWDMTGVIPNGVNVTSATVSFAVQSSAAATVRVHRITSAWDESTVTWNSFAGAFDPAVETTFFNGGLSYAGPVSFSLTSLAQAWVNAPSQNNGILVEEDPGPDTRYWTSEDANPGERPTLTVCWVAPTCNDGIQDQGERGVDCGGPCALDCPHPGATEVVNAGDTSRSPHYRAVYTFGQPTQNQDTATSPSYRVQGGLIGANGSLP